MSLGRRVVQSGAWGHAALERSKDRDDALRAERPYQPSTSRVPSRCTACREWSSADSLGLCRKCRNPFVAAVLVGLARVGES